jgi:hypothetical protein
MKFIIIDVLILVPIAFIIIKLIDNTIGIETNNLTRAKNLSEVIEIIKRRGKL